MGYNMNVVKIRRRFSADRRKAHEVKSIEDDERIAADFLIKINKKYESKTTQNFTGSPVIRNINNPEPFER